MCFNSTLINAHFCLLQGAGTREGTGKCKCTSGYKGDLCNECKDGYYEESENDKVECKGMFIVKHCLICILLIITSTFW